MSSIQYQVRLSLIVIAVGALAGCQPGTPDGIMPEAARKLDPPEQNGARIYYTGASQRGGPISRTGGSAFGGSMMGMGGARSWLTCASCHGPEGRGGIHAMHMSVMKAPDIRYAALSTMPELKGRQSPYGLDDFRKTVQGGRHPDGEQLDSDMPRWEMSEADLSDLFAFLKSLPQ
jgi:cytochrome c553